MNNMTVDTLQDAIKQVKHASDKEGKRPVLGCANFSRSDKDGYTDVVTTDGFRLAHATVLGSSITGPHTLDKDGEIDKLIKSKDKWAGIDGSKLTPSDETYPKWQQLIPDIADMDMIEFNIADMIVIAKALKDATIMRMYVEDDHINITAEIEGSKDNILFQTKIDAKHTGGRIDVKVAINPKYVLDCMKALSSKYIPMCYMYIMDVSSPVMFKHVGYEEVIMPMFVQW